MKVAVTGAGGFVGLNILQALNEYGHEPIAVIRNSTKREYITTLKVKCKVADVLNKKELVDAFKGTEAIIHCAGATSNFPKDRKTVWCINKDGTSNVLNAAIECGIEKIVFTSTTSTIGSSQNREIADEKTPLGGFRSKGQYAQSKVVAEKLVLSSMDRGIKPVIVNPAEVMGPFDYHFGWGSVILGLHNNSLPFIPPGGGSFCSSQAVGRAHVEALTKGKVGERYILAGVDILFPDFFQRIADLTGCSLPSPFFLMNNYHFLFFAFKCMEKIIRKKPPLDPIRLKTFFREMYFNSEKANKDLSYKTEGIDKMIVDSFNWYKQNNYITKCM